MSHTLKKQTSPLKRETSMHSLNGSSLAFSESRHKSQQEIEALLNRFYEVNGQVEIPNEQHFNLINYEREDQKIKYDPQMMTAKLRKLENRAEINRAQREIENRDKKKLKRLSLHKHKQAGKTYKTIYDQFLKDNKLTHDFDDVSDEESTENKAKPKGINFFTQLKRHPVLLEYTLKKINMREVEQEEKLRKMESTLTQMKKQSSEVPAEYKELYEEFNRKLLHLNESNPESIIENRFSKFYTKKSSDKLSKEVTSNARCSRMIEKQNEIVSELQENSLSKENKLKLKSKLNEIITGISKSEKLAHFTLPKLHRDTDRKD